MNLRLPARPCAALLFLTVLISGCSANKTEPENTTKPANIITGTISYSAPQDLSPEAELEIKLLDVSLMDVAAIQLGATTITNPGQVPVAFTIEYEPAAIESRNTYSVRATLRDQGRMRFTTDTVYPVLTRGAGNNVDLTMVAVYTQPAGATASLTGTRWELKSINNERFVVKDKQKTPFMRLDKANNAVNGYAGCNNFAGTYTLEGEKLSLGPMAMTAMACIDGMEIEQRFTLALEQMNRYEITERRLRAYKDDSQLLTLEAGQDPR